LNDQLMAKLIAKKHNGDFDWYFFVIKNFIKHANAKGYKRHVVTGAMKLSELLLVTRFAWWRQDLHAIGLLRAHIGEWTMTQMLDYWWVMCFTSYRLNWNSWIWIPFPVDSDCALLCAQVDKTRYSSIASGNNCIVQLCKCVSLHL
jgi:hypothetical protein